MNDIVFVIVGIMFSFGILAAICYRMNDNWVWVGSLGCLVVWGINGVDFAATIALSFHMLAFTIIDIMDSIENTRQPIEIAA